MVFEYPKIISLERHFKYVIEDIVINFRDLNTKCQTKISHPML